MLGRALMMASFVCFAGCSSRTTGSVSGTISVDGSPLTMGLVTFHSSSAVQPSVVSVGVTEGSYVIQKIAAGPAKIAVQSIRPSQYGLNTDGTPMPGPKGSYIPLPEKLKDPALSGLSFEVKPGDQKYDFDIKTN